MNDRLRFDPPSRRRRRWGWCGAALLLLLVVLALWRPWGAPAEAGPTAPSAAGSGVHADVAMPDARPSTARPTSPSAAPAAGAAASSAGLPERPASEPFARMLSGHEPLRVNVCGHGEIHLQDLERLYPQPVIDETRLRLAHALMNGNEREQVTGLLLARTGDHKLAPQSIDALVALAERSADPWVYRAAVVHGCRLEAPSRVPLVGLPAACARLNPAAWQQRDPDNAAPALWEAFLASEGLQADALAAAIERAAGRTRYRLSEFASFEPLLAHPAFRSLPPPMRMSVAQPLWTDALTVNSVVLVQAPTRHCEKQHLADPARRAPCDALARLWRDEASSLLEFHMAFRFGERLGWPAEVLQAMDQSFRRFNELRTEAAVGAALHDCERSQRVERYWRDSAAQGEIAALRRLLSEREGGKPKQ